MFRFLVLCWHAFGLFSWVLLVSSTAAQSLSIHLDTTNRARLEAMSSLDLGYRLQASADNETWEDIGDQASGPFSCWIDSTSDRKRFFRLRTWPIEETPVSLVMVGDSTVADFTANSEKFYGWGQGIYDYLKPSVQALNLAAPAQSSESFLSSRERAQMVLVHPDFVLVQFGMMDTWEEEGLYTTLAQYEANLKEIVQAIRDFQGTPILVTPPVPGYFDAAGKVLPYLEDRSAVVRKVSRDLQTYLIDLNKLSKELFEKLGPAETARLTRSDADRTHFTLAGAKAVAALVANAFPKILYSQVQNQTQDIGAQ